MTTDGNSLAAFYCPVHQVRFHAAPAEAIECDQASHAVGYGFPNGSVWTYCCACATFSPLEPAGHYSQLTECPVCEREVAKRCLCYACQVLTIETVVQIHRKVYSIDTNGVTPGCPGCGSPPVQTVLQHDCPELGISFLSARRSCLYCELTIAGGDVQADNETNAPLCNSCGIELVAPFRFCKKCGTAQAQTETNVDQYVDEDPTEDDFFDEEPFDDPIDEPVAESEPTYTSWDYSPAPVPTKRRTPYLIGGAATLISVAILIAVAVTSPKPPPLPPKPNTPEAPPGMVYIAGGDFMMGSNNGDEFERPAHRVTVAPFFMDVTEVTCDDYLNFLARTGGKSPRTWTAQTCQQGAGHQPVTGVDWNQAKEYADWARKRLPTEEEWEFAARGVQGATYPWGNEWRSNAANAGDSSAHRLMDVGSYPNGKSSAGVMDLLGNAWEWTASDVVVYPGGGLSSSIPEGVKVVRGGSWQAARQAISTTYRGYLHITNAKDYSATGFRCVKNIGPVSISAESQR